MGASIHSFAALRPGRRNLVISRGRGPLPPPAELFNSFDAAVGACASGEDVYIIGGEAIYALALPRADCLELTEIRAAIDGDAHFPDYDRLQFVETARQPGAESGKLPHDAGAACLHYDFVRYERRLT